MELGFGQDELCGTDLAVERLPVPGKTAWVLGLSVGPTDTPLGPLVKGHKRDPTLGCSGRDEDHVAEVNSVVLFLVDSVQVLRIADHELDLVGLTDPKHVVWRGFPNPDQSRNGILAHECQADRNGLPQAELESHSHLG